MCIFALSERKQQHRHRQKLNNEVKQFMKEKQIDTRSFREIYEAFKKDKMLRNRFYDNLRVLRQDTVRSYGTGRREPSTPAFPFLIEALKKTGIEVGDGRYLFAK